MCKAACEAFYNVIDVRTGSKAEIVISIYLAFIIQLAKDLHPAKRPKSILSFMTSPTIYIKITVSGVFY